MCVVAAWHSLNVEPISSSVSLDRLAVALPAVHLHDEGLFDGDPAAVDDHALRVRQVSVVGVLQLDGVNHSLKTDTKTTLFTPSNSEIFLSRGHVFGK